MTVGSKWPRQCVIEALTVQVRNRRRNKKRVTLPGTVVCAADVIQCCRKELNGLKSSCNGDGGNDFPLVPVVGVVTIAGLILIAATSMFAGISGLIAGGGDDDGGGGNSGGGKGSRNLGGGGEDGRNVVRGGGKQNASQKIAN